MNDYNKSVIILIFQNHYFDVIYISVNVILIDNKDKCYTRAIES